MTDEGKINDPISIDFDEQDEDEEETGEMYERMSFIDIVEDAMPATKKKSARAPDDVAPLLSRWLLAFSTGDYQDAIAAASDAVFKLPDDHSVRCKLATSFLMAGMYPEAINSLEYILNIDPDHEEARGLADSREILAFLNKDAKEALKRRDFDAALSPIEKSIRFVPEYAESYFLRAIVRYQKGLLKDCKEDLQKTMELEPQHSGAKSLLTELEKKMSASSSMFGD